MFGPLDTGSTDRLAQELLSMLMIGDYLAGLLMPVYQSEAGLPQVVPMPFWLLPYPSNPNHLPTPLTLVAAR